MNLCTTCGKDFGSVSGFDAHRVGKYPQTGPGEYLVRERLGLEEGDWTPEKGRRCLEDEELVGWTQDNHGRWRQPISEEASLRLRQLRSRVETT